MWSVNQSRPTGTKQNVFSSQGEARLVPSFDIFSFADRQWNADNADTNDHAGAIDAKVW